MEQPNGPEQPQELHELAIQWNIEPSKAGWSGEIKTNGQVRTGISARIDAIPQSTLFLMQLIWKRPTQDTPVESWSRITLASDNVRTLMQTTSLWVVQLLMEDTNIQVGSSHTILPSLRQELDDFFSKLQDKRNE